MFQELFKIPKTFIIHWHLAAVKKNRKYFFLIENQMNGLKINKTLPGVSQEYWNLAPRVRLCVVLSVTSIKFIPIKFLIVINRVRLFKKRKAPTVQGFYNNLNFTRRHWQWVQAVDGSVLTFRESRSSASYTLIQAKIIGSNIIWPSSKKVINITQKDDTSRFCHIHQWENF